MTNPFDVDGSTKHTCFKGKRFMPRNDGLLVGFHVRINDEDDAGDATAKGLPTILIPDPQVGV